MQYAVAAALALVVVALVYAMARSQTRELDERARLLTSGLAARAKVLEVGLMNSLKSGTFARHDLRVILEVPGGPPVEASGPQLIPLALRAEIVAGATLEVRVDPARPTHYAIRGVV